jgi:hypothetical protein
VEELDYRLPCPKHAKLYALLVGQQNFCGIKMRIKAWEVCASRNGFGKHIHQKCPQAFADLSDVTVTIIQDLLA